MDFHFRQVRIKSAFKGLGTKKIRKYSSSQDWIVKGFHWIRKIGFHSIGFTAVFPDLLIQRNDHRR